MAYTLKLHYESSYLASAVTDRGLYEGLCDRLQWCRRMGIDDSAAHKAVAHVWDALSDHDQDAVKEAWLRHPYMDETEPYAVRL